MLGLFPKSYGVNTSVSVTKNLSEVLSRRISPVTEELDRIVPKADPLRIQTGTLSLGNRLTTSGFAQPAAVTSLHGQ